MAGLSDKVRQAYFRWLTQTYLGDFPIYHTLFFDQGLDYIEKVAEIVAKPTSDFNEQTRADTNKNWIVGVWSRSPLRNNGELPKKIDVKGPTNQTTGFVKLYKAGLAEVDISVKFFSPGAIMLEDLEEYMIATEDPAPILVDYGPDLGYITAVVKEFKSQSFDKLPRETHGSISTLQLDATLVYPILLLEKVTPVITDIVLDVYIGSESNAIFERRYEFAAPGHGPAPAPKPFLPE